MDNQQRPGHGGTPRRSRSSIKKDPINPSDFLKYEGRWSCEECSHFDTISETCTLGYPSEHHRKAEQLHSYYVSGKMALCRFHEID